jgi:hypothetical protein
MWVVQCKMMGKKRILLHRLLLYAHAARIPFEWIEVARALHLAFLADRNLCK